MVPRLLEFGTSKEIVPEDLAKSSGSRTFTRFRISKKIVVNIGLGEAAANAQAAGQGGGGTGQRSRGRSPSIRRARKSVANFKLRQGQADRLHGDASGRPDVGVPGSPRERVAAPRARLQGRSRRRHSTGVATTR